MAESTNPTDPEWRTGSFNQGIVLQKQRDANDNLVEAINLKALPTAEAGQTTTSDTWSGKMIGLLMTDVNDSTKNAIPRSFNVNNLTVTLMIATTESSSSVPTSILKKTSVTNAGLILY